MKKLYHALILVCLCALTAQGQCVIDSSNTQPGFSPLDSTLPVIVQGPDGGIDTSFQLYVPPFVNNGTDTLTIHSIIFDSTFITGLPTGINYIKNPANLNVPANSYSCISLTGVTQDTVGMYVLNIQATVHVSSASLGDTLLSWQAFLSALAVYGDSAAFSYAVWVAPFYVAPCSGLDTALIDSMGGSVYPVASDLPCIVQGVPYQQFVQGKIPASGTATIVVPITITVDSIELDSIHGMPTGITFGRSPMRVPGGGYGCVTFSGTTTDTVGIYPLTAYGIAWLTAEGQEVPYRGNLDTLSPFGAYYLRVVNTPDSCHLTVPTGISSYSNSLNAIVSVYPNPNNGVFELTINAASPVTGEISVYDGIGRIVYEQPVDVLGIYNTSLNLSKFSAGLYTLQIHTPQGSTTRKISIQ